MYMMKCCQIAYLRMQKWICRYVTICPDHWYKNRQMMNSV